jgi:hypothetical protein
MKQFILTATLLITIGFAQAQSQNIEPKVYLTYSISKPVNSQDARDLSSDEIKINLHINDLIIDTYIDYGSGEYSKEDRALYLASDISQKTYTISILNESQIVVSLILFLEGEEHQIWNRTYSMNIDNKWRKTKCEGECDN